MNEIVNKPWGSYEVLSEGSGYKVKRIIVKPNQRLSYQYHHKRQEFWVFVEGFGQFTLNDETFTIKDGDSVFIDTKDKHRIECLGERDLVFIETQYGECEEEDIVRIQDDYNR
jgi:mannose-6-phosphate isomerase-like protein (cupin superfamily)